VVRELLHDNLWTILWISSILSRADDVLDDERLRCLHSCNRSRLNTPSQSTYLPLAYLHIYKAALCSRLCPFEPSCTAVDCGLATLAVEPIQVVPSLVISDSQTNGSKLQAHYDALKSQPAENLGAGVKPWITVLRFPLTFVNKFPPCRTDKAGRASRILCCACGGRELSFRIQNYGSWVLELIDMSKVC